jgi:hypothetical protein
VWRWARDGDPRLPAYKTWAEGTRDEISYRFRKEDVLALREPAHSQDATLSSASGSPPLDDSSSQRHGTRSTIGAAKRREGEQEDQAEASDPAQVAEETTGPVTP